MGAVKSDIGQMRADMATQSDLKTLRAYVAADILTTRKELSEQIVGLRQTVIDYQAMALRVCPSLLRFHASAAAQQHHGVGPWEPESHGVIISELEARVRRVEQHLNLPSL
jgi:hypothetical protein